MCGERGEDEKGEGKGEGEEGGLRCVIENETPLSRIGGKYKLQGIQYTNSI
jgi:hypothetical protein